MLIEDEVNVTCCIMQIWVVEINFFPQRRNHPEFPTITSGSKFKFHVNFKTFNLNLCIYITTQFRHAPISGLRL